jgi:hypothetical protein
MRFVSICSIVLLSLAPGCSEYDLTGDPEIRGEPNPPNLVVPPKEDRIVQVTTPAVDVLWTIDNSCSMADEQTALTQNFQTFMNFFLGSGLDYHVGVVSTDDDDAGHQGRLREVLGARWIDDETQDPINVFSGMANLGTGGSANESGRATTYRAIELKKDAYNDGFIREEAGLHIIVISDEQDNSTTNPISKGEFIDYLGTLKETEDLVTFSSIVNPPNCGFCNGGTAGTDYIDVTNGVGGILWDINDQNWSTVLEQLGVQAAGLKREFFLTELPVTDSIEVWIEENGSVFQFIEGDDWVYNVSRNSVVFNEYIPEPLSEIYITYEQLAAQ